MTNDNNNKQKTLNELLNNVKPLPDNWQEIIRNKSERDERYAKWKNAHGWKDNRIGTCKVCGSPAKPDVSMQYDPSSGPMIFGPGSRNQIKRVHKGFYCINKECGILYKWAPAPITIVDENPWIEDDKEIG